MSRLKIGEDDDNNVREAALQPRTYRMSQRHNLHSGKTWLGVMVTMSWLNSAEASAKDDLLVFIQLVPMASREATVVDSDGFRRLEPHRPSIADGR